MYGAPNIHSETVFTLPDEELEAAFAASADVAEALMTSDVSTTGFNVCKYKYK